ncbi:hypothetical protein V1505DRAFT_386816 [Lipomyces doorenjongii]
MGMTMIAKTYEHHVHVVSRALSHTRSGGGSVDTIQLSGFQLLDHSLSVSDLTSLSGSLQELLASIWNLRVTQSESILDLLSHGTFNIHHFDMCYLTVDYRNLRSFLSVNQSSFLDVQVSKIPVQESTQPRSNTDILCSMLNVSKDNAWRETRRHCLPIGFRRQVLVLKED